MKVLHLNQWGTHAGGVEGYIAEVSAALRQRGHFSHLVYFADHDPGDLLPASTHVPLGDGSASVAKAMQAIERVIDKFQPDVAYVHAVYSPELIDRLTQRLPTVAYAHSPYLACPGSAQFLRRSERTCPHRPGPICFWSAQRERCCWGRNPMLHARFLLRVYRFKQAYRRIGRILLAGAFMQRLLVRVGFMPEKIHVLPPILLSDVWFDSSPEPRSDQILYAGRLVQEKGLGCLLKALSQVETQWRLLVAGEGPARGQYQDLACRLGIADRVEFAGWLNPGEMKTALQSSACVAMPSLWPEPFGRLGAEAFACARPVVAFASGGVVDWLEHQVTGFLVAPGDVEGLAQGIQRLVQDPAVCQRMGQRAREYAWSHWRCSEHVDRLLEHLESVCQGVL